MTKAAYSNDSTAFDAIQSTIQKVIGSGEARIKVNRWKEIYRSISISTLQEEDVSSNMLSSSSAASLFSFEEAQVDKGKEKEGQSTLSFVEESIQTEDVIDVPVLVMNYTLSFYAGDIAPLANASFAVRVVSERLQAATSSGEYDVILREEAVSRNSVSLASASVANRTLTFNGYVSAFVHSGHPTSQPSGQPSSSPSSQPSSQPTSSPTLVPATRWRNRLQEELHARYDEEKHRNGRSIYSELMVWGEVLYGGQDEWSHFLLKDVRLALNSRKLSGLSLILANGSDTAAAVEVSCTEETALDYLSDAVQNPLWNLLSSSPTTSPFTTTTEVKSILCGSDRWAIQYCATAQQYESSTTSSSDYYSSIIYPSLCVNCSSPCNQTCQSSVVSSSGRMSGRLPVNESCPESGGSYFKILTFSTEEEEQSGRYFVVTFSTLWGAVLLLCCWNLFRGGTDRVSSTWRVVEESSGQVKKAFWKLKRMRASSQISPISSHSDAIQAVQKFFAWCSEPSYPVVSSFLHTLLSQHRDLKVWQSRSQGPIYALYTASHLICYAIILAGLLQLIYPMDHGLCSEQKTEADCEDVRAALLGHRHLCVWSRAGQPQAAIYPDPAIFQTHCYWRDEAISSAEAFYLALIAMSIMLPVRVLFLEKALRRWLLPPTNWGEPADSSAVVLPPVATVGRGAEAHGGSSPRRNQVSPFSAPVGLSLADPRHVPLNLNLQFDGGASPSRPQSRGDVSMMKVAPFDEDLVGGVRAPSMDLHVLQSLTPEEYFQYDFEIRSPTKAASGVMRKGGGAASKLPALPIESRLLPRQAPAVSGDLFETFFNALLRYRNALPNPVEQQKVSSQWGLNGNAFDRDLLMSRDFVWKVRHFPQVGYQPAADYFADCLEQTGREIQQEVQQGDRYASTAQLRPLWLFVMDMMGWNKLECQIFRRRSYRLLHPYAALSVYIKASVLFVCLATNAVLIYLCWQLLSQQSQQQVRNWLVTVLIAVFGDVVIVENVDNAWCHALLPNLCMALYDQVQIDVLRIIRACELAETAPLPNRTSSVQAAVASEVAGVAQAVSAALRKISPRKVLPHPAQPSAFDFDSSHYFFVSKHYLKKRYAGRVVNDIVYKFRTHGPERLVLGPWQANPGSHAAAAANATATHAPGLPLQPAAGGSGSGGWWQRMTGQWGHRLGQGLGYWGKVFGCLPLSCQRIMLATAIIGVGFLAVFLASSGGREISLSILWQVGVAFLALWFLAWVLYMIYRYNESFRISFDRLLRRSGGRRADVMDRQLQQQSSFRLSSRFSQRAGSMRGSAMSAVSAMSGASRPSSMQSARSVHRLSRKEAHDMVQMLADNSTARQALEMTAWELSDSDDENEIEALRRQLQDIEGGRVVLPGEVVKEGSTSQGPR